MQVNHLPVPAQRQQVSMTRGIASDIASAHSLEAKARSYQGRPCHQCFHNLVAIASRRSSILKQITVVISLGTSRRSANTSERLHVGAPSRARGHDDVTTSELRCWTSAAMLPLSATQATWWPSNSHFLFLQSKQPLWLRPFHGRCRQVFLAWVELKIKVTAN